MKLALYPEHVRFTKLSMFVPVFHTEKDPSREAAKGMLEVPEKSCVPVTAGGPWCPALEICVDYQLGHAGCH